MTQGDRVKELRKSLNLTLEKFGECIGLKKSTMSAIETGRNSLTNANIKAICREFNANYFWLRDGIGEMFIDIPDTTIAELKTAYNLSLDEVHIIKRYLSLSESDRNAFIGILKNIIS